MKTAKLLAAAAIVAVMAFSVAAEAKNFPSQNDNAQTFSRSYNTGMAEMGKKHHGKKKHHRHHRQHHATGSTPVKQEKAAQIH